MKNSSLIEVSWSHLPKNDTNGIITKYTILFKRLGTSTEKVVNVTGNHERTTVAMKPFANYSIEVAAVNSAGTGPYSNKIVRRTLVTGLC